MKTVGLAVFVVLMVVPSLSLVILMGTERLWACEMNPYAGLTCPRWAALLMPPAALGIITLLPTGLIAAVWAGVRIARRFG